MNKEKEVAYANNTNIAFGYVGPLVTNTLVFNSEDVDQSAILLIGTNQIDLRRFDFSTITDIEINHVRYIREDMIK